MAEHIRVLIVDDHGIVRKGLRFLISNTPDMEVVGEAANGLEAVEKSRSLQPDIILMDLQMPKMTGIEAIRVIKQADAAKKILVLTSFADDQNVFPAIKGGASGYILKDAQPNELLDAIRAIHQGKPSLHPVIAEKLMRELAQPVNPPTLRTTLTRRELEVLRQIAQGHSNHEIALNLVVSERTVTSHIENILEKLHLANRTQAALYAIKEGLVEPPKDSDGEDLGR
jgi:two-component system, NarL family, response regulator LiaR